MVDVKEDFPDLPGDEGSGFEPGDVFDVRGRYELVDLIGAGGMGEVWHAKRVSAGGHHHDVAVKFLLFGDEESETELANEALLISELRHDNIVGFVDSGRSETGTYFTAMEYVRGIDLDGLLDLHGLGPERVARGEGIWRVPCPIVGFIMYMVARALHHAHTRKFSSGVEGLVHRDISPGNVLIESENGFVKLTDFGVAATMEAASEAGVGFTGKVPYAAPEVLRNEPADPRADIYSLGIVAYELITGFNPNSALEPTTHPMARLSHALISLDQRIVPTWEVIEGASRDVGHVVMRMLENDPARRYANVDDLMRDLRMALYSGGIGPTADGFRDYLRLLGNPDLDADPLMRSGLVFLYDRAAGGPLIHRPWRLSQKAKERVAAGENPAREP